MFYKLIKLFTLCGLLCLNFVAKADSRVHKMHGTRLAVKQYVHAEIFAEDSSLASVLNNQVPYKQVVSHPAFLTDVPTSWLHNPNGTFTRAITERNGRIPQKVLLILFPFHVFW